MATKTELIKALRDAGDHEFPDWKMRSWKISDIENRLEVLLASSKPRKRVKSRPLSIVKASDEQTVVDYGEDGRQRTVTKMPAASKQPPVKGRLTCTRCGATKTVDHFAKSNKQAYAERGYNLWCGTKAHPGCVQDQRSQYVAARKASK